ncbi:MAG: hypothetical protein MAG473_00315 [Thaumarchaeota archaeon]|nr:hypothetical protein [Nitrososphaerota archaeon]
MVTDNLSEKTWKNDFLPNCRNKTFTVSQLIGALRMGMDPKLIPADAKPLVDKRLKELGYS